MTGKTRFIEELLKGEKDFIVTTEDRVDKIFCSNPNSIHPSRLESYQLREAVRLLAKQIDILFMKRITETKSH